MLDIPNVAGAVIQTALSLIHLLTHSLIICESICNAPSLTKCKG